MSNSEEQHVENLQIVFKRLGKYHLSIKAGKCQFGQPELTYLGYVINASGYKSPQDRVDVILNFPNPDTIKKLLLFLGIVNYYRRCLPKSAEL